MWCGNALKIRGLEPEHESADEIYDDWYVHNIPLSAVRSPVIVVESDRLISRQWRIGSIEAIV